MKILHTADWHLGQTFYEYSRYDEHVRFLDWLRRQIKERKIDVLLVAGDIFDLICGKEIIRLPKTMRKVFRLSIGNFLQN